MPKKKLTGTVVSDKMHKTVVVQVERVKAHPKYQRRYKVHKKYKAHDEQGAFHVGETVVIEETNPISKDKHFTVIAKI